MGTTGVSRHDRLGVYLGPPTNGGVRSTSMVWAAPASGAGSCPALTLLTSSTAPPVGYTALSTRTWRGASHAQVSHSGVLHGRRHQGPRQGRRGEAPSKCREFHQSRRWQAGG